MPWSQWMEPRGRHDHYPLTAEDVLADDWEIKREPRTWTIGDAGGPHIAVITGPSIAHGERVRVREVIEE